MTISCLSVDRHALKKLNRLGVEIPLYGAGMPMWGSPPCRSEWLSKNKIPIVIWGEHGYLDLCGQFDLDDFPESELRRPARAFCERLWSGTHLSAARDCRNRDLIHWRIRAIRNYTTSIAGGLIWHHVFWDANKHVELIIDNTT